MTEVQSPTELARRLFAKPPLLQVVGRVEIIKGVEQSSDRPSISVYSRYGMFRPYPTQDTGTHTTQHTLAVSL